MNARLGYRVRISEFNADQLKQVFQLGMGDLSNVCWSPDGRLAVTTSVGVLVRDPVEQRDLTLFGVGEEVHSMTFVDGGKFLAVGLDREMRDAWKQGNPVLFLEMSTGDLVQAVDGHGAKRVESMCMTREDELIVTASSDRKVCLWRTEDGELDHEWTCDAAVNSVDRSPDASTVLAGLANGRVILWNLEDRTVAQEWECGDRVHEAIFSPCGRMIAVAGAARPSLIPDRTACVSLIRVSDGATIADFRTRASNEARCVCFSPDGVLIAMGGTDENVHVWRLDSDEKVATLLTHNRTPDGYRDRLPHGWIQSVAFSPDGSMLAVASSDNRLRVYDTTSWELIDFLEDFTGPIRDADFSSDGRYLAASTAMHVAVWDLIDGTVESIDNWRQYAALPEPIAVRFSPNSDRLATSIDDRNGTAYVWQIPFALKDTAIVGHDRLIRQIDWSEDGRYVATASDDSTVKVRLIDDEAPEPITLEQNKPSHTVCFSADTKLLATGGEDETVRVYDVDQEFALVVELDQTVFEGSAHTVFSVAFSPDCRQLAVGTRNGNIHIYSTETWTLLRSIEAHQRDINAVAFAPDGSLLASASQDKTVRLWRIADGELIRELTGHCAHVNAVTFAADGTLLASTSDDGTLRMWGLLA